MSDINGDELIVVAMIVDDVPLFDRFGGNTPREVCLALEKHLRAMPESACDISFVINCTLTRHQENVQFYLNDLLAEMNHDSLEGTL